jgi:pyruvoyl-dependent arginine decarboxylase
MFPLPTSMFLTKGIGVHRHQLTAFELALRDADIEQQNLVSVSSILPPHCKLVTREEGAVWWPPASASRGRPIPACTAISPNITASA